MWRLDAVVAPHGIRGEVKVELLTDYPERFRGVNGCTWRRAPICAR